jgi:hypothetical protein
VLTLAQPFKKGNKYILTVIGEGTRYPEAFPLPSIEAERIAQSLVQLFSRVGVARVILSNQGSNFTSTTQANGKCELYNGTLSLISDKRSLTLMICSITDFSTSSSPVIANFNISVGPLTGHPYNS